MKTSAPVDDFMMQSPSIQQIFYLVSSRAELALVLAANVRTLCRTCPCCHFEFRCKRDEIAEGPDPGLLNHLFIC